MLRFRLHESAAYNLNFPSMFGVHRVSERKRDRYGKRIHFDPIEIKSCQNTVNTLFECSPSIWFSIQYTTWCGLTHAALSIPYLICVCVCMFSLLRIVTFALCFTHKIYLLNNLQTKKKMRRFATADFTRLCTNLILINYGRMD